MIVVYLRKIIVSALLFALPTLTQTAALNDGKPKNAQKPEKLLIPHDIKELKETVPNAKLVAYVKATNSAHNITREKFFEFRHVTDLTRACDYMVALNDPTDQNINTLLDFKQTTDRTVQVLDFALSNNHPVMFEKILEKQPQLIEQYEYFIPKKALNAHVQTGDTTLFALYLKLRDRYIGKKPFPPDFLVLATLDKSGTATRLLIEHGADVDAEYDQTNPILHAIHLDNSNALGILLDNGASVHHKIKGAPQPICLAVIRDSAIALAQLLYKDPTLIHYTDPKDGSTLAHKAVQYSKTLETVATVLDYNADADMPDHNGDTPLHLAASLDDSDAVDILLEHSADPNVLNKHKRSPLWIAHDKQGTEVIQLLVNAGANPSLGKKIKALAAQAPQGILVQPKGSAPKRELTPEEIEQKKRAQAERKVDDEKLQSKRKEPKVKTRSAMAQLQPPQEAISTKQITPKPAHGSAAPAPTPKAKKTREEIKKHKKQQKLLKKQEQERKTIKAVHEEMHQRIDRENAEDLEAAQAQDDELFQALNAAREESFWVTQNEDTGGDGGAQ